MLHRTQEEAVSYKQASKTEWQNDATKNGQWPGLEVINTGALQRIADDAKPRFLDYDPSEIKYR